MKISVVLDTNFLFVSKINNFNELKCIGNLTRLVNMIKENNFANIVKIIIPKIVVKEILQQQSQQCFDNINKFASMKFPGNDIKIDDNYNSFLEKIFMEYVNKLNNDVSIKIIDYPSKEKFYPIIDKAVMKKAPFEGIKKQSDKGFKDTIVWESLIEYKKSNTDENIILITNDKIFLDKKLCSDYRRSFSENIVIIESKDKEETISKLINEINKLTNLNVGKTKKEKIYDEFKDTIKNSNFNMLYEGLSYESLRDEAIYSFKDLDIIKFNFSDIHEYIEEGIKIDYFVAEIKLTLRFTAYDELDIEECYTDYWEYEVDYNEYDKEFTIIGYDGFSDHKIWQKKERLVLKKNEN